MSKKTTWVIWSVDHSAYWRAKGRGYTSDIHQAGRFTEERAKVICSLYRPRAGGTRKGNEPSDFMAPVN